MLDSPRNSGAVIDWSFFNEFVDEIDDCVACWENDYALSVWVNSAKQPVKQLLITTFNNEAKHSETLLALLTEPCEIKQRDRIWCWR
jgi:hypothetical protein